MEEPQVGPGKYLHIAGIQSSARKQNGETKAYIHWVADGLSVFPPIYLECLLYVRQ